jgi:hypothetical protein
VRPLAADGDPHLGGPSVESIPAGLRTAHRSGWWTYRETVAMRQSSILQETTIRASPDSAGDPYILTQHSGYVID